LGHPALGEVTHRQQLTRERSPLGPLGIAHQAKQFRIPASFEHIFDYANRADDWHPAKAQPVAEIATGDNYVPEPRDVGAVGYWSTAWEPSRV
jgi:hypothetical protein